MTKLKMSSISCKWSSLLLCLKTILFSLFLSFLFIFALLPLFLLRYCVEKLSKWLRPDLDCIVLAQDAIFSTDYERWHVKSDCTAIIVGFLNREFSMTECRSRMDKFARQDLNYRKLRQRMVTWMGFQFWKTDEDFRIEDHVKYYPGEEKGKFVRDKKWLIKAQEHLMNQPYLKNKSPWEILLVPRVKFHLNDEKEFCVMIEKMHHAIGDGISAMKIMELFLVETNEYITEKVKPTFSLSKKNVLGKVMAYIALLVKAPYIVADIILTKTDRNKTPWNYDNYKFQYESCLAEGKRISLPYLKSIKNRFDVSLNSVILLGVSSLVRNALLRSKIKLPEVVHCLLPLPLPNHPKELCSHVTAVQFGLPIGISDPKLRLQKIDKHILELKSSVVPQVCFLLGETIGRLPFFILKHFPVWYLTGNIVISPAFIDLTLLPTGRLYCGNFTLSVPQPLFNSGFFICCSSSNNILETTANFDRSIFRTNEEVEQLFEYMYQDYKHLSGSEVNFVQDNYFTGESQ